MLRLQTTAGSRYFSDLLELAEEAAGPDSTPQIVVDLLIESMGRLLSPRPGYRTEIIVDRFSKELCKMVAAQPVDVQTFVLQPLLTTTQQKVTTA